LCCFRKHLRTNIRAPFGNNLFTQMLVLEISKVVPVPAEPEPKFFLNRTRTKMFFWTETVTKIFLTGTLTQNLFLKEPGPKPNTFFRRDRDEIFFLTGTKNDWSRSCLVSLLCLRTIKARVKFPSIRDTTTQKIKSVKTLLLRDGTGPDFWRPVPVPSLLLLTNEIS
jgi:hypothetical protein